MSHCTGISPVDYQLADAGVMNTAAMDFITGFCVNIHVCISLYLGVELLGLLVTMFNLSRNCQNIFSSPFHPPWACEALTSHLISCGCSCHLLLMAVVVVSQGFDFPNIWLSEHVFMCLLMFCLLGRKLIFRFLAHFVILLLTKSSLVILDPSPLSDIGLEIFSPMLWVFQFLGSVFWNRIFLFWKYQFFFFFYIFILS